MNKFTIPLVVLVLIMFCLYIPLDSAPAKLYHFRTVVDDYIPLITAFIAVYISYFGFLLFTLIYFSKLSHPRFTNTTLTAIILACFFAYLFYLSFQNYIIRPSLPVVEDWFDLVYLWVNANVPPYNAFPSLHVAISTICVIAYKKINSKIFGVMSVWAFFIILSTVFSKQHYFADVVAGIPLGFLCYFLAQKLNGYFFRK